MSAGDQEHTVTAFPPCPIKYEGVDCKLFLGPTGKPHDPPCLFGPELLEAAGITPAHMAVAQVIMKLAAKGAELTIPAVQVHVGEPVGNTITITITKAPPPPKMLGGV